MLLPWIKIHIRHMLKDLLIAADQVFYNLQVPSTASSNFPKNTSPGERELS
jgi:hypothetical protein